MKEFFSYTKFFTILLSVFYIFGLLGSFYGKEIIISIISFAILCVLILFFNLGFKKSIILFLIFTLGLIRAKNSLVLPNVLDDIFSNEATIYGQIISPKDV